MPSPFETPDFKRHPGMFATPASAIQQGPSQRNLYPDLTTTGTLPTELQMNPPTYNTSAYITPDHHRTAPPSHSPSLVPAPTNAAVPGRTAGTTDNLGPVERAAKTINETLDAEKRYPQLDDIVLQGQSADYELAQQSAWEPFARINNYTIPDAIFEQYNRATSHTMMGLFPEIKQAWITVDNRLYLWDYATQSGFQGYEGQNNNIHCVRLLKPKPGVFENVNYVLVIATDQEIFLLGVNATPNDRGVMEVVLYDTKMRVPTKGLEVTVIEGSKKTGRIFFAGKADNDVYEFTYQSEERWFHGRCGKVCHTSTGVTAFAPRIPLWSSGPQDTEYVKQMVIDDTRSLLYTLSSKSSIRTFHLRGDAGLTLSLTHPFANTLSNIRVMVGNTPLLTPDTPIVSISPVSLAQARRTHLIAVTRSGCRLFMSAVASEYGYGGSDAAPTSMQVIHIRYPPNNYVHNNVRRAKVFAPGYFFCFLEKSPTEDELLLAAPDSAKIQILAETGSSRIQLPEQATKINLDSRVEACELVSAPFAAQRGPQGFGNETCTQHDLQQTEIAVLTNSGVHIIRRRRLVEVFDGVLRYGSTGSTIGVEGEVRKFFDTYGRTEGCASALAVACGASTENSSNQAPSRVTDVEVHDLARRFFIEFGGKPVAGNVYDDRTLPSLDGIKLSGRADGLALYISRIVRSIWKAWIVSEVPTPAGGINYVPSIPVGKLRSIQEQLIRLATFLQDNRSFIVGLSGAESMMVAGTKFDEVANQAEHRMLHALVTMIESMIEGISFTLFLFDDKLTEIILTLEPASKLLIGKTTYGGLFSTPQGQNLAKELVTAIVNRNIAAGGNVDAIADALRRRCGSFCSADDVVVFKAVEQVKKAKSEKDPETKARLSRESLRLFEESAAGLSMDNLREIIRDFCELEYYPGAVQLALTVAKEADRGNLSHQFLTEPPKVETATAQLYHKRLDCYEFIFNVLSVLDYAHGQSSEYIDGLMTTATRLRNDTWNLIYNSDDELFHYKLYDWLYDQGGPYADRLLEVESPYVLGYLTYKGAESLPHCELLWQYHSRRERFLEAAEVLHELALSEFSLTLEKRLEFFSRAKGFCNSSYGSSRQRMNELSQTIQEELDVAVIQDDVLKRTMDDTRISPEKKHKLEQELGKKIISLSELFNNYASPYGYHDICLCIFQAADYRVQSEIKRCWEQLISQKHSQAKERGNAEPFEIVADTLRTLGNRFSHSEYIFPPNDLIPLLEIYAYEHQRDIGPPGWVVDTFLDAGVAEETVVRVLEAMFWQEEVPFKGVARRRLISDAVYVVEKWWMKVVKRGGGEGFRASDIETMLRSMVAMIPRGSEAEKVDRLLADIARRGASLV